MSIIASRRHFGLDIGHPRVEVVRGEVVTGLQQSAACWAGLARCTDGVEPGLGSSFIQPSYSHDLSPRIEMAIFMKINCSSVIAH